MTQTDSPSDTGTQLCSIADCKNKVHGRGWCNKHYLRWFHHGDPEKTQFIRGDDQKRFWSYAISNDKTGCWEWSGARDPGGYGVSWLYGKSARAPRMAWTILFGEIPDGQVIRHKCDNPPCVNPSHLELGTHRDNTNDSMERGLLARGERNASSKLTDESVRAIRTQHTNGASIRSLARSYDVSRTAIKNVITRKTWKWVA